MNWLKQKLQQFAKGCFVGNEDNKTKQDILYPHKLFPGYYISIEHAKVYSIKSGKLKPLVARSWNGKTTVTMSHNGRARYQSIKPENLRKYADRNPSSTIKLDVKY